MRRIRFAAGAIVLIALAGCSAGSDISGAASKGSADAASPPAQLTSNPRGSTSSETVRPTHRQVIRNASLRVRVPNVEAAEKRVSALLRAWGGYVENSAGMGLASEHPSMALKLRVPVGRFDESLEAFAGLGTLLEKQVTGQDVTAQAVDLDARIRTMQATEESYRKILAASRSLDSTLSVREKIGALRGEIESLQGQRKALGELAALSTVDLTLEQSSAALATARTRDPGWAAEAWASSSANLADVGRGLGTLGISLFAYSPLWGPPAFLAAYLWRRSRSRKESLAPPPGFSY